MINEATLIARVGKKDLKQTKNGSEMASLYVATNDKWVNHDGVTEELTTWHLVRFYGKLADIVKRYCHVGNLIYIKGKIENKQITVGERAGQWAYSITGTLIKLLPGSFKKTEDKPEPEKEFNADEYEDSIPF